MNLPEILQRFDSYKKAGGGRYMASCPMPDHNDSDPSVSVCQDVETGKILLFCWGCKRRGNELVQAMGLQLSDLFGDPGHPSAVNTDGFTATETSPEDQEALAKRVEAAMTNLDLAKDYLMTRFALSTATGRYLKLGVDSEFGSRHLIIPFRDTTGKIVGMQGRRLVDGDPRWRSVSGGGWSKIGCFGWDLDGPVCITEGPSDALSVVGRAKLPTIAIRGASNTDDYLCQQIRDWLGNRPAIVIGDNGEAGERFAKEISEGVGIPYWIPPISYSDVSDFLADNGSLEEAIERAQPCVQEQVVKTPADERAELQSRIISIWPHVIDDEELIADLADFNSRHLSHYNTMFEDLRQDRYLCQAVGEFDRRRNNIDFEVRRVAPPPAADNHGEGGGRAHAPVPPDVDFTHLPEIIWNVEDQLHITESAIRSAMDEYGGSEFYRSATGQYVKVVDDDIVNLRDSGVLSMLSQMGHWRVVQGQREIGHVPSVASKLVSDPSWECGLPEIKRRVEVPFMLEDGDIVSDTGYHADSGIYLLPRNGDQIIVPPTPSIILPEHINRAREIFEDVTEGFVFKDSASKANLIAMTLTSPLRELFKSNPMVPLLVSTAPQSGSGKGTSIRVPLSTCGIGPHSLATTAYNADENEFEKKLVGKLLKKTTYIFLDNIRLNVNSSVLEQMLTAANYDGRTLGYSEVNSLSTLVLWVATLQSTGAFNRDLTRRTVPVELIKNWKGEWIHKNIEAYLADMRGELIWACFVVARKWMQDGAPISEVRLDGYGGWTECIGGMLEHVLGYGHLIENLAEFRKSQDQNALTIDGMLERWLEEFGEEIHIAHEIIEDYEDPALHQLLGIRTPHPRGVSKALERMLNSQQGHIINNTHMWQPLGNQVYGHQGVKACYRCMPLED